MLFSICLTGTLKEGFEKSIITILKEKPRYSNKIHEGGGH